MALAAKTYSKLSWSQRKHLLSINLYQYWSLSRINILICIIKETKWSRKKEQFKTLEMKGATQRAALRGGTVWKSGDTTYTSSLSLTALNPVLAGSSRIFAKHLAPMPTGNGGEDEWAHRKIMNNKNNFSHISKMFITPRASQKLDLTQRQSSMGGLLVVQ